MCLSDFLTIDYPLLRCLRLSGLLYFRLPFAVCVFRLPYLILFFVSVSLRLPYFRLFFTV